ncbi:MAG: sugar-binding protein [Oscillospiraceae bacterium]|jgi:putative multiple sugar transport system substrate-binding protein|nr:sugar-binding protein [Oscillospiraceae bacterium]
MNKTKRILCLALVLMLAFSFAACSSKTADEPTAAPTVAPETTAPETDAPPPVDEGKRVGISMPTQSLQRWNQDGDYLKQEFEAAGHTVDLQYGGDNDVPTQVAQVDQMVADGCDVIVIAAIDGSSLSAPLAAAKAAGITIISYDRLLLNSDAVDYYATFNNVKVGTLQGTYIENALDLKNAEGPFNIEFFAGDPGDSNAGYFFQGAIDVLKPYLDSGVLVCPSGGTEFSQAATADWNSANAQSRMENIISQNSYAPSGGTKLDAVMCSNDSTAFGVETALVAAGWTKDTMPIVTGQDCDKANVINMKAGLQSMSVFKDTRTLAARVVTMVTAILEGAAVETTTTYPNGTMDVPTFECDPGVVTVDGDSALGYQSVQVALLDSGYYSEADITG